MNPNRKFTRRQINATLATNGVPEGPSQMMQRACGEVVKVLPRDWGFALMAFPLDSRDGGLRYVSNGDRKAVLKLLKDFVTEQEAKL